MIRTSSWVSASKISDAEEGALLPGPNTVPCSSTRVMTFWDGGSGAVWCFPRSPAEGFVHRRGDLYKCPYCGPRGTGDVPVPEKELDLEGGPTFRVGVSDEIQDTLQEAALGRRTSWMPLAGTCSCDSCWGSGSYNPGVPDARKLLSFWRMSAIQMVAPKNEAYIDQLPADVQSRTFREGGAPRLYEYPAPLASTREVNDARLKRLQHLEAKRARVTTMLALLDKGRNKKLAQPEWKSLQKQVQALGGELEAVRAATLFMAEGTSYELDSDAEGHMLALAMPDDLDSAVDKVRVSGRRWWRRAAQNLGKRQIEKAQGGGGASLGRRARQQGTVDALATETEDMLQDEWGAWIKIA